MDIGLQSSAVNTMATILVVIFVQLRLLANMLDGMVAIEGGKQSKVGILYNEIPDRVADSLFMVALGYHRTAMAGLAGRIVGS